MQALTYTAVALSVLALIIPALLTLRVRKLESQGGYQVKRWYTYFSLVLACGVA